MAAADTESPVAQCWACGVLIAVPHVSGAPAPIFRCGWCGAINDHSPAAGSGGGARPRAPGRARRALRALAGPARWLVVAFVVLLMGAVTSVGLCIVLPRAFPNPLVCLLHSTFALMLLTATSLHYIAACCHSPGRVGECVPLPARLPAGHYPEGAFEGWAFCRHAGCQAPKPPGTHHCRTCGFCVVDLDHHCPFINNCVGRANLRAFIAFLACICAACLYALCVCCYLVWLHRAFALAGWRSALASAALATGGGGGGGWRRAAAAAGWVARLSVASAILMGAAPWWLLATYYLILVCAAALALVGILLGTQLKYLATGMTYIDYLKAAQDDAGDAGDADVAAGARPPPFPRGPGLRARLREVMGSGNPLAWLLPRWDAAGVPAAGPGCAKKAS